MRSPSAKGPRIEPDDHAAFLIVSIANRVSSSASQAYTRCFGVGVMEWRVIGMLAGRPGAAAKDIAQFSGLDKSAVSRAVQALVQVGHVATEPDPEDSRRIRLRLTPSGKALHDRIIVASLAREELLLDGFTAEDRAAFFGFLRRVAGNTALVEAHDPGASQT